MDARAELIELVNRHAVKHGDFTLASGAKSSYYIDCRKVTLLAAGAKLIGQGMLEFMAEVDYDAIGGMTLGADPIVGAVITLSAETRPDLKGLLVRKEAKSHGTGQAIEGPLEGNERVVVVEDVTTSGGSAMKAINALREAGCQVVQVLTVLDRNAGATELFEKEGIAFRSLLTLTDLGLAP
ncbi:Orotate phosphoribosyltransferase [Planctomycetes bacterium Pan216]|uniref:Orotate phosphoribosyltransferase n=1 Tax=Kolteria novifilia TaxID=2527975 RepID=A0A518B9F7_9BACT|nr:Orotate phosphoribosyltransferase [Planctomycetes bacterium Pan216]